MASVDQELAEIKKLLDTKYNTTGGTVSGPMVVTENVTVNGELRANKVWNAKWNLNDLAELFPSTESEIIIPGTIVMLDINSETENYVTAVKGKGPVVGIVTGEEAFLMGGNKNSENPKDGMIAVSLSGRVYTMVQGPVNLGDRICISDIPGIGCVSDDKDYVGTALEAISDNRIKKIRLKVR